MRGIVERMHTAKLAKLGYTFPDAGRNDSVICDDDDEDEDEGEDEIRVLRPKKFNHCGLCTSAQIARVRSRVPLTPANR